MRFSESEYCDIESHHVMFQVKHILVKSRVYCSLVSLYKGFVDYARIKRMKDIYVLCFCCDGQLIVGIFSSALTKCFGEKRLAW